MSDELQHECSRPPFEVPPSRAVAALSNNVVVSRLTLDRIAADIREYGDDAQRARIMLWLYGAGATGLLVALTDMGVAAASVFICITLINWLSGRRLQQRLARKE